MSEGCVDWMHNHRISLAVSTYQIGKLLTRVIAAREGYQCLRERLIGAWVCAQHKMGMAFI